MKKPLFYLCVLLLFILLPLCGCKQTDYSALLSKKGINRFYFASTTHNTLSLDIEGEIEESNISALMPHGIDLALLTPSFDLNGYAFYVDGELQKSGETSENFTTTLTYSLYSYDGANEDYTVTVKETEAYFTEFSLDTLYNPALSETISTTIAGNSIWFYLPHCYNLSGITPSFETYLDGPVMYNNTTITSASAPYSFDSPLVLRVYEASEPDDREYMDYQISVCRMTSLIFEGQENGFDGDYHAPLADNTITVELPSGTDLSKLKPTYTYLGKTITFNGTTVESGTGTVDFSSPVSVIVDTGCGVSHEYSVNIVLADDPQNEEETTISASEDITAPAEVSFAAADGTSEKLTFNWTNPTDEDFAYLLMSVNAGSTPLATDEVTTVSTYSITPPNSATTYTVTIKTVDTAGNISNGSSMSFTLPDISGISETVTFVNTAESLAAINDSTESLSGYYIMTEDVDLSGMDWAPIGDSTDQFVGTFDGDGHTISITITGSSNDRLGVFGHIQDTVEIKNLNIVADIETTGNYVGALAGAIVGGTVTNCTASGTVSGNYYVGGLIGYLYNATTTASITDCHTECTVTASSRYAGGILGGDASTASLQTSISNCYSTGAVSAYNYVGGIAGQIYYGNVLNCYSESSIESTLLAASSGSTDSYAGGIVGMMGQGSVKYCYYTGTIDGCDVMGGVVGCFYAPISSVLYIQNCYAIGSIIAQTTKIGGICGGTYSNGSTANISNCYSITSIDGTSSLGGIYGESDGNASISSCYYDADLATTSSLDLTLANTYATSPYDMTQQGTYSGWDFTTTPIWSISSSINDGYPYLTGMEP